MACTVATPLSATFALAMWRSLWRLCKRLQTYFILGIHDNWRSFVLPAIVVQMERGVVVDVVPWSSRM